MQTPEPTFELIQTSILQLWDVVNQLSTVPPPKCDRYRVTIFGSARLSPEDKVYAEVRYLAGELTRLGCDIVTGGGPGLMQAANEGAVQADPENRTQSIGLRVALEFEQAANPFVEELYHHRTFFSRLHHFVLLSHAFIVVDGGIGTTLEATLVWQLLQVRQLYDTPLIFVGPMWAEFVAWAERSMVQDRSPQLANTEDMKIPVCVATVDEAIAFLKTSHGIWLRSCDR